MGLAQTQKKSLGTIPKLLKFSNFPNFTIIAPFGLVTRVVKTLPALMLEESGNPKLNSEF